MNNHEVSLFLCECGGCILELSCFGPSEHEKNTWDLYMIYWTRGKSHTWWDRIEHAWRHLRRGDCKWMEDMYLSKEEATKLHKALGEHLSHE